MDVKKLLVLMGIVFIGAQGFSYTLIGPPTAELQKTTGNVDGEDVWRHEDRHGYVFSYSEMDLSVGEIGTLEDFKLTRHYYTWGVALDENFNFSVLVGTATGEVDKGDLGSTTDLDGDYGFSWGFNLKSTFHHGDMMDIGLTVQMTWFSTEDTVDGIELDFNDVYDLQVAVGPTFDMGGWKLYGGAYFYMLEGDLDVSVAGLGFSGVTVDIEEDDNYGGFVGAQFSLHEKADLIVEYAQGNDHYGLGLSVGYRF